VAANFAIVFGDCYYHVLASYEDDAAVSHYGPGALHLRELLAHAIKLKLRRFDFTIGDEPYKDEWSDLSVKLYDHSAAATWRGWPVSAASVVRRRLKRFVKQTPAIWKLVSRLRATVGAHPSKSVAAAGGRDGPRRQGAAATGGRLRHGRHGFVAADRGGRHFLRRGDAAGRALALFALRARALALGRFLAKYRHVARCA
jgi:hypothetical protein